MSFSHSPVNYIPTTQSISYVYTMLYHQYYVKVQRHPDFHRIEQIVGSSAIVNSPYREEGSCAFYEQRHTVPLKDIDIKSTLHTDDNILAYHPSFKAYIPAEVFNEDEDFHVTNKELGLRWTPSFSESSSQSLPDILTIIPHRGKDLVDSALTTVQLINGVPIYFPNFQYQRRIPQA